MSVGMAIPDPRLAPTVQANGSDLDEYWRGTGATLQSAIARSRVAIAKERDELRQLVDQLSAQANDWRVDGKASLDVVRHLLSAFEAAHRA